MVFQRINTDTISIKTGTATAQVKAAGTVKVGDYEITGPGEYDISGIGFHAETSYAMLFSEGVRVVLVWGSEIKKNDEDVSGDIFVIFGGDVPKINALIKEQDPRVVLVHERSVAEQVAAQDGITFQEEGTYKITASTLPADSRLFVLLV